MPRVATAEGSIISLNIHLENKFLGGICICAPRKIKSDRIPWRQVTYERKTSTSRELNHRHACH